MSVHPPSPKPRPSLSAGQVLAGRFRIVRFLARGGVGEVYEAEDLELRTSVALKSLRSEIADDGRVLERFRREILLARQVTHPNVCRIFDLFRHHWTDTSMPHGGLSFITMELLRGQSLAERIAAGGAMGTGEALPLVRQMASALAAAHRAGIVHRDFKSANVMLVPEGDGTRAVVTDFGLAFSARPATDDEPSLTGSGGFVGSWAYMAPEQLQDGDVSQAADVYAFGVVLYEMVTARRPFVGDSTLATAVRRLTEPPLPPRHWVPDLEPRWERAILSCLEREPERRPSPIEAVVQALAPRPSAPRRRGVAAFGLSRLRTSIASLGVVLATTAVLSRTGPRFNVAGASEYHADGGRRAVAVLGFRNLSGRADTLWLSTALSETLGTELAAGERLRMIPGEDVAQMKMGLKLAEVDSLGRDTLRRVHQHLGADLVVLGSYLDLGRDGGGRVRFDLRVQDAATGETVAALTEEGEEERIFDLLTRTGTRLRQRLGVADAWAAGTGGGAGPSLPATPAALRLYAEGVARLRVLEGLDARRLLEAAIRADASYFPAHVALSEAWSMLGHQRQARDAAHQAVKLSGKASREQRLWVEGRFHEADQQWDQAAKVYASLRRLFPDDVEYGLRLAASQTAGGHPREALTTLAGLRRLSTRAGGELRVAIAEAEAHRVLSEFKAMLELAHATAETARERGAPLLAAKAMMQEGHALHELGEVKDAADRFEQARAAYEDAGDQGNRAWALASVGYVRWEAGDPTAEAAYREALTAFERIGDERGVATMRGALATLLWKQGRLDEAASFTDQALAAFREINDRLNVSRMLNAKAVDQQTQGRLEQAQRTLEESLALNRELGNQKLIAVNLLNMGNVLKDRGDLEGARQRYQEALEVNERAALKSNVATVRHFLGQLLAVMGRYDEARRELQAALAVREELDEKLFAANTRLALATLALDEGRPGDAEPTARRAAEEFGRQRAVDDEVMAHLLLARALAEQGKPGGVQALGQAQTLVRRTQTQTVHMAVSIVDAQLRGSSGDKGELDTALRSIARTMGETRKAGQPALELQARLVSGELGLRAGRPDAAAALQALEQEARSKGYETLARRASAARSGRRTVTSS